ncbi:MAG: hypothetical protein H7257_12745, partial [Taibaiella sp.]|nr:hypothetical protein [Taibaiella sp.]
MKYILLFTAFFPFCLMAQQLAPLKDTAHAKARKPHLEGYVQAGFTNEFWVLSAPLTNGVTSLSYGGKGGFAGIGFKSKNTGKPLGFGLALDILAYSMDATLKTNELAQLNYAYGRLTPVVYLNLKSNNEFKFSLCAT